MLKHNNSEESSCTLCCHSKLLCISINAHYYIVCFPQIARLREEGSRQLEEEQRLIREQIQREREAQQQQTGDYTNRSTYMAKI